MAERAATAGYVQLFGTTRLQVGLRSVPFMPDKRFQLLAYLAYSGDWVSRERLTFLFWPDTSTEKAQQNLRQLLHRLRPLEWLTGLEVNSHRLRWSVDTDAGMFQHALEHDNPDEALALYAGPLFKDLESEETPEFTSWLEVEREHLHTRWRESLLRHAQRVQAEGRHDDAAKLLSALLDRDPLDEEALGAYLQAAARAGRQEEALRAYRDFTRRLHEELGLEPTSVTQKLAQAIQEDRAAPNSPLPVATAAAGPVFPAPATTFVGRDLELGEIAHLLARPECRFLTLTGPGGIGKTRVALRAAEELTSGYSAGSYFVSLEALSGPEFIATAIAGVLKLERQGQDEPLDEVLRFIAEKQMLLVLDNYEHLLEGSALVSRLVRACPNLKLLITSRERLDLAEEWLFAIEGLPFSKENTASFDEALFADAVTLFIQRARQVRPTFTPTDEEVRHIIEICRLVEGSPLAIELAAAWVRMMPPSQIVRELEESPDFLTSSGRNIAGRHKSIRAVFEHSWRLLTPIEQEVLRKLSVFKGGFRKGAAAVVAGGVVK